MPKSEVRSKSSLVGGPCCDAVVLMTRNEFLKSDWESY